MYLERIGLVKEKTGKGKHLTPLSLLASRIHTHHTTPHHRHRYRSPSPGKIRPPPPPPPFCLSLCSTTPPLSLCSSFQILNQHHHHRKSQSPPPPPPQKVSLSPPPFCPSLSLLYATDRWLLTLHLVRTQELLQISAVEFGESCCKVMCPLSHSTNFLCGVADL
ncbi:hypothetical protein QL285_009668 [Trifolium repens]|nr:hypothetical protein QL285_009668 [Trifolium repens]